MFTMSYKYVSDIKSKETAIHYVKQIKGVMTLFFPLSDKNIRQLHDTWQTNLTST